jgi:hypothetical protein
VRERVLACYPNKGENMKFFKVLAFSFPKVLADPVVKVKVEASVDVEVDTNRIKKAFGVKAEKEVPA